MANLDEIIESLREDGREDEASELEKLRGSTLRKKAEEAAKIQKERDDAVAELTRLKTGPAREKAFRDYGVDFDALRPAEKRALEQLDGELDEAKVEELVRELDLPLVEEGGNAESETEEKSGAQQVAAAARRAPAGGGATTLKPEEVASWAPDKLARLYEKHPDEYEALLRGETVTGIAVT
jgi:hypothetical protein